MKKSKSKLETYKEKKKEMEEDLEYLRQVEVSESQGGGAKYVGEKIEEEQKKEQNQEDDWKTYLQNKSRRTNTYIQRLTDYGNKKLYQSDLDEQWVGSFIATDGHAIELFGKSFKTKRGLILVIKSPKGAVYVRGMTITSDPNYDINAVNVLVIQAQNTIDGEKGLLLSDNVDTDSTLKRTKGGIYLPN